MDEREIEYFKQWYIIFFKCRITHKSVPWDCTCYIFANYEDMQNYCEKNKIKFSEYNHKDYYLLNEKNIGCIAGYRFNKVVLVSSNVYDLVKKICEEVIQDGYDVKLCIDNSK